MEIAPPARHFKRLLVSLTVCGAVASALLTLNFYRDRLAFRRQEQARALTTIAELKSAEIAAWRQERLYDARVITNNAVLARSIRSYLRRPRGRGRELLAWFEQLKSHEYAAVLLFDGAGRLRLSSEPRPSPAEQVTVMADVIGRRTELFQDFHAHGGAPAHLAVVAPVLDEKGNPAAVIELQIDPWRSLYALVQRWPIPTRSGETLLIRREGNEVVYLNDLRHRRNAALALRMPLSSPDLLVSKALAGGSGILEGRDYRGVPVVSAIRRIPDSPWILVAKIDRAEADSGVGASTFYSAALTLLVALLSVVAILLAWTRRESQQARHFYEAETRRQALVRHYEYLHRYANDIIVLADDGGRILEANERAIETYGYPSEKLLTLHMRDLYDPAALAGFEQHWGAADSPGGVVFETAHRRADGSVFPVEVSSRVITVDERAFRQSIIRDISERKRSLETLQRTQTSLVQAQAMARLGSWEVAAPALGEDTALEQYLWTDEVYRIFGVDREAFTPSRAAFLAAVHPDDRANVEAAMARVRATGRPYEVEHRVLRPNGTVRHVREHADCIFDDSGALDRIIGTVQDITDYKQLEEQFLQAQKLESLGRLAGGVAHDFNNLLTVINGYCDLLAQAVSERDPLREKIVEIQKAGESAAALTRQLLVFSRKQRVQARPVDLNSVASDAEKMLKRLVGEDVELTIRCDPSLGSVLADTGQVQQVIMNLVVNARDAMPHGGSIVLETAHVEVVNPYQAPHPDLRPGPYVMLAVSDTGSGMDDHVKARIFEPFFTTKPRGLGTGLGLSTVYGIVTAAGGSIGVSSELGKGTTFRLYFPCLAEAAPPPGTAAAHGGAEGSETILIVEDQADVRRLAATVLRFHKYTVLEAAGAQEALLICRNRPVHLLLTDVVMPGISGPELAEEVRRLYPQMKVVFMSGYTEHANLHDGVLAGNVPYLDKPFTAANLAATVRGALGKGPAE